MLYPALCASFGRSPDDVPSNMRSMLQNASLIIDPDVGKVKSYDSTENDLFVIRIIFRVVVFAAFGDEDCVDVGKGVDKLHAFLKTEYETAGT